MTEKLTTVGIGEARISTNGAEVLIAYGLGSCVGVTAYDPLQKVGGLLHVMLPTSQGDGMGQPFKFADTGVPLLLKQMERLGALPRRLVWKIAGGARMFAAPGFKNSFAFNVGERNVEAVMGTLSSLGAHPSASDTGGGAGRTLQLFVRDGTVMVRTTGQSARPI